MLKITSTLLALIALSTTPVLANTTVTQSSEGNAEVKVNINNNLNSSSSNKSTTSTNVNIQSSRDNNTNLQVNNSKFSLEGKINSISGEQFNVSGQNLKIDPNSLNEFQQNSAFKVGNQVKIMGKISSDNWLASSIQLISENPSQSENLSSPTAEPSTQPNSSASPSADIDSPPQVTNNQNPIDQVIEVLKSIISSLQKLLF